MRPIVDPRSPLRRDPRAVAFDRIAPVAVFLAGLGARLAYVWQLRGTPLFSGLSLDPLYYHRWAERIAAGDWFSGNRVFEQSPLYAYILAAVYHVAGEGLLVPRVVQAVAGAVTCVLVFYIARRIFGRPAALVAGLLAAAYAPAIFYDGMIMKTCFAVLLSAAMTAALVHSEASRRGLLFLGGVLLGLAALVRDNLILLAPLLACWLVVELFFPPVIKAGRVREAMARVSLFAAGVLLVVLPVTARNLFVAGEPVLLTSGGGEVFYIGNNPDADGTYAPPPFVRATSGVEHEDFRAEAGRRLGRELTRREASNYWLAEGTAFIEENPGAWVKLMGRKALSFFNAYELPDNQNFYHHREFVPFLRWLPTWTVLFPLALAGVAISFRLWRELLPVYLISAGYVATVLLFFNFARFRMPLVPLAIVLAAEAIVEMPALLWPPAWSRTTLAGLVGAAAGLGLVLVPLQSDPLHVGQSAAQMAELRRQAGQAAEATAASDRGIKLLESVYERAGGKPGPDGGVLPPGDPGRPEIGASYYAALSDAYLGRARIEAAKRDADEAERYVRRAVDAAPDDDTGWDALLALGRIDMDAKATGEAMTMLARARAARPPTLELTLLYAQGLHRQGKLREAVEMVEEALAREPEVDDRLLADANFGLGLLFRDLGDRIRMKFYFRETLEKNPSHPRAEWMKKQIEDAEAAEAAEDAAAAGIAKPAGDADSTGDTP